MWLSFPSKSPAQEKKFLKPKDYALWHRLDIGGLSTNGKWTFFYIRYESGSDTLVVKSTTRKNLSYYFAGGTNARFSPDGEWFVCKLKDKGLGLLDLKTGKSEWIDHVQKYDFVANGTLLLLFESTNEVKKRSTIKMKSLNDKSNFLIHNVLKYSLNKQGDALACLIDSNRNQALKVVRYSNKWIAEEIISDSLSNYNNMTWQAEGNVLAFVKQSGTTQKKEWLCCFDLNKHQLMVMPPIPKGKIVDANNNFIISNDGKRIFFGLKPVVPEIWKDTVVKVWHARDSWIYPQRQEVYGWRNYPKLYMWDLLEKQYKQISSNEFPNSILTGDQQHVLLYNEMGKEPQVGLYDEVDVYLLNLNTDKRRLLIKQNKHGVGNAVRISPGGRYIAFFKDKDWWTYDLYAEQYVNLTKKLALKLESDFANSESDGSAFQYGTAGWTVGDKEIIVYDEFDCWLLSPDGKRQTRLTKGREQQICFRMNNYLQNNRNPIDLSKGIILAARGRDNSSGYYFLSPNGHNERLVYGAKKNDYLQEAQDQKSFIYMQQTFEESPRLMYYDKGSDTSKVLFQSNPQQKNYHWGRAEVVHYQNSKGEQLKGALFYPAGYSPGKLYPMVVQVYQNLSRSIYEYDNPTLYTGANLLPSVYAAEGYLVLCPDINYTAGDPGISATDCVDAAVKAVIKKGIVNEKQIGLAGHSFGGYETAFIVTKSKLFAAAIAGAAVTDVLKAYLTINESWGMTSDMWRYEKQQYRFGFSYYDHPEAYLRNSPIHQAANINTPLLIWTGEEDYNVHWQQGVELHLAMRRLKRQSVLLVYPEEGHILTDRKRQEDLSNRRLQWFDYYLKGKQPADWIINGVGTSK